MSGDSASGKVSWVKAEGEHAKVDVLSGVKTATYTATVTHDCALSGTW